MSEYYSLETGLSYTYLCRVPTMRFFVGYVAHNSTFKSPSHQSLKMQVVIKLIQHEMR
jgi:hypothetical protein